jgi:AcrR family transcriptional regulator
MYVYEYNDARMMKRDSKILRKVEAGTAEADSPKQKRALRTRRELMRSARAVFARDGFQNARIEDIAARAGKTRGAFYANFEDKEDVFFAIFEEELDRDMEKLRPVLQKVSTLEERLLALARYLCKLGRHRQRTLLNLEFKLYAVRHPNRRKRLADLYAIMRLRCSLPEIDQLLPEYRRNGARQRSESLALGAVMDGLALNQLFDPLGMADDDAVRSLRLCLGEKLRNVVADGS